jgi:short-subunit dehydrogenase
VALRLGTAIITGACGGLGSALTWQWAARGGDLILADLPGTGLDQLASRITAESSGSVRTVEADLAEESGRAELERIARMTCSDTPERPVTLLFNNAGISGKGAFTDLAREQHRDVVRLNVLATTDVSRRILPLLRASHGALCNVASLGGFYPMPYMSVYSASKTFIIHFTLALREELRSVPVSVYVLCPGAMPTNELTCRDLAAQGLLGHLTVRTPSAVASHALRHMERRRAPVIIPGRYNRILRVVGCIPPKQFTARFMGHRWAAIYRKAGLLR